MYRCINAFAYGDQIYSGGVQVDDGDPILATHASHFARVEARPVARLAAVEEATAAPGERRALSTGVAKKTAAKKAPAKRTSAKEAPASSDGADVTSDQGEDGDDSKEDSSDA